MTFCCTVLNAGSVAPLVTALTLSFVAVVRSGLPWIVLPKFGFLPRWGAIALIVVAMDGLNWFVHLANHLSERSGAFTSFTIHKRT